MLKSTQPTETSVSLEKDVRDSLLQETTADTSSTHNTERVVPLSFAQQQMWIQAQLIPDAPVYNESLTIHLPGRLNIPALEQSLNEIIERHEAWRTSFPLVNGQPVQMIHPALTFPLSIVDLQHLPKAQRESEALRLATEQAQPLFDLTKVPLLRATLVSLDEEDHRLFLTLHHIIFDRSSIYRVFLPELHSLYEAFSSGNPSPLPPPAIQYADFAIQQRESWQENIQAEQLAYWKQQLAHAPAAMNLPTDRPTPLVQSYRGSKLPFTLSKDMTNKLKALSDREGVTLYMTLVAAFQILLYRYTAQQDIMIGTSTETREAPEEQSLIGLCINTLVLRTDLSGNPTFSDFLKRVREVVLEAEAHQAVPFEYLLKELQPTRGVGANTLLRVMLSLEAAPPILSSGWTVSQSEVELHTTRSDLSLALEDRAEGLAGWFEYSTDVFDEATIARMMQHWQTLLASAVADPTCQIAKLPLLTEAERHQLLVEWNANQVESSENGCIHQFFEAQVERTPEAVAVVFEDTQLTYHELNVKANQLAHYLQRLGVGPEVLVCICLERSLELIVGLLAILKAGGAFVPLDPSHPQDRLDFILQDSQAAVLLTQQHIAEKLPEHRTQIICVDTSAEAIAQEPATNPVITVSHENLCYAIYTSGSTGNPKGVLITHGSMVRHCFAMSRHYQLDSSDRVLQFTTLTFDISLEQIFPTLISGAQLVLRDEEVWSTLEFHEKVLKFGLTVMNLGTPYWHQLAQEWADDPKRIQNSQLRLVVIGGDRMIPYYLNLWQQTPLASVRLLNAYGPAETTITSTTFEVPPQFGKDTPREQVPIGRPLPHRRCYVLDTYKEPVPVGVPGELYIGGDILARSYLNRPELSTERFIPDPFSDEPDARMYKTGDLVRYLPDGNIEFLGRVDFQVKIRGFRIELGEIEGALRLHPAVQENVVIAHEDSPGNKSLVAYIVPASGLKPTVSSLQQYLKEKLPEYMVPAAFVFLDALPLTPNGKIDRHALPDPSSAVRPTEEAYVAPTSMAHYQLLQIWEELLSIRPIGIRDNFFHLGGHSLLAARLVVKIEQVFGKRLPLSTLFAGPTIEQLADVLEGEGTIDDQAPVQAVQAGGSRRPFFFLHGDWKGGAFYCFKLAKDLGPDQPFYVLPPYKFDSLQAPPPLEEIATAHLQSVRAVQPEGPYLLGGFCDGGLIAYEMALQLQAEGQAVDLLLLMDPEPTGELSKLTRTAIKRINKVIRIGENKQLDLFSLVQHVYRYLRFPHYKTKYGYTSLFQSPRTLRQHWEVINDWVVAGYVPPLYSGKITFFWARDERLSRRSWWAEAYKDEEMHIVPGTHITCRTEYLQTFSDHVKMCIEKAQTHPSNE